VFADPHGRWHWLVSLLWVLALAAVPASAELPWAIRTWQSDEGLPDNTVVGIGQTPDVFLWVAASTGLGRFDGVRFRPYPVTAPGAPAGRIKNLLADRRNRVWIAKENGVVYQCVLRKRLPGDGQHLVTGQRRCQPLRKLGRQPCLRLSQRRGCGLRHGMDPRGLHQFIP
jgi:ligand-binding sensor domain-containing protein